MIPKPQHSDSVISKDVRTSLIVNLTQPIIMPTIIEFDRDLCRRTIEIKCVAADWMLATKLISRKISISEMAPESALRVGCLLSQHASAIHGTSM